MKLIENDREVEVSNTPLLEDLLIKWGYDFSKQNILVKDVDKLTTELSAWGIPWKRTKWSY